MGFYQNRWWRVTIFPFVKQHIGTHRLVLRWNTTIHAILVIVNFPSYKFRRLLRTFFFPTSIHRRYDEWSLSVVCIRLALTLCTRRLSKVKFNSLREHTAHRAQHSDYAFGPASRLFFYALSTWLRCACADNKMHCGSVTTHIRHHTDTPWRVLY